MLGIFAETVNRVVSSKDKIVRKGITQTDGVLSGRLSWDDPLRRMKRLMDDGKRGAGRSLSVWWNSENAIFFRVIKRGRISANGVLRSFSLFVMFMLVVT
ncbi:hypothetical protein VRB78_05315 [Pseudomonas trivialis]|uniref:hypothetical protein n=1 Tax=Pseudomonas trivialis TaxID=200450 RepID=UPI0030D522BC